MSGQDTKKKKKGVGTPTEAGSGDLKHFIPHYQTYSSKFIQKETSLSW